MKKRCSVENLIYADETWIRLISNSLLSSVTDPDSHLTLSNRSHALYRLNRCEAALADADRAVTLQPYWGKVSLASPLNTKLSRQTPWIVLITLALQAGCLGTDARVGHEKKSHVAGFHWAPSTSWGNKSFTLNGSSDQALPE